MSVIGWKELDLKDEIVWDTLAKGKMDCIEFLSHCEGPGEISSKERFMSWVKRVKPRTKEELTVLVAMANHWYWSVEDICECVIKALELKKSDGPFKQLKETYGYPVFKDQVASVMSDNFGLDLDKAYELADDMAKRKSKAKTQLLSFRRMSREKKELLWKIAPYAAGRKWYIHYTTLFYEACWVVCNSVAEYYEKNPIKID